jgi:hypothetical protein
MTVILNFVNRSLHFFVASFVEKTETNLVTYCSQRGHDATLFTFFGAMVNFEYLL